MLRGSNVQSAVQRGLALLRSVALDRSNETAEDRYERGGARLAPSLETAARELLRMPPAPVTASGRRMLQSLAAHVVLNHDPSWTDKDTEALVERLFRAGDLTAASALASKRRELGHPWGSFDYLANAYSTLAAVPLAGLPLRQRAFGQASCERPRVLSFLSSAIAYQSNGYTHRTHALLQHTRLKVVSYTKPGFPWAANLSKQPVVAHTTEADGIVYGHIPGISNQNDAFLNVLRAKRSCLEVIRRVEPDVVHAASNWTNALPALLAANDAGLPFVYEMRGIWELTAGVGIDDWESTERFHFERALETYIAAQADAVVTLTDTQKAELAERGVLHKKIHVVPNGFQADESRPSSGAIAEDIRSRLRDQFVIGYVGSLVNYEGLQDLIQVLADRPDLREGSALLIVGDGPYAGDLRGLAHKLGLDEVVLFTGRVAREEAQAIYDLIDLCVLPRLKHKVAELISPLKLVEILAKGKVLLASDVASMAELVGKIGYGELFSAGDRTSLAEALARIRSGIGDLKKHYLGAPQRVAAALSWDAAASYWDAALVEAYQARSREPEGSSPMARMLQNLTFAGEETRSERLSLMKRAASWACGPADAGPKTIIGPNIASGRVLITISESEGAVRKVIRSADAVRAQLGCYDLGSVEAGETVSIYLSRDVESLFREVPWHVEDGQSSSAGQSLRLKRESLDALAVEVDVEMERAQWITEAGDHESPVRYVMAIRPVAAAGARTFTSFSRLPFSSRLGARFQYVQIEPEPARRNLKLPMTGRALLEFTPWQKGVSESGLTQVTLETEARPDGLYALHLDRSYTNVLVAAAVNENLVDGSVVWLRTLATALAEDETTRIYVVTNSVGLPTSVNRALLNHPRIIKVDLGLFTSAEIDSLGDRIELLDRLSGGFDRIIVRSDRLARRLNTKALRDRLIVYAVGLLAPSHLKPGSEEPPLYAHDKVSGLIFQSSTALKIFQGAKPQFAGQLFHIGPSVDEDLLARISDARDVAPEFEEQVVYAGKIIREYRILDFIESFERIRKRVPQLGLVIIGSKTDAGDPAYASEVRARMSALGPSAKWVPAASPEEVFVAMRKARAVWAWRSAEFESQHFEISTKLVEAIALGTPPVVYPSDAARDLLGAAYPGFAKSSEAAASALEKLVSAAGAEALIGDQKGLSASAAYSDLRQSLHIAPRQNRRLLVASHDFRFFEDIEGLLQASGAEVFRQVWRNHSQRFDYGPEPQLDSSDVVFCDWCMGNAVWWSQHAPPGVRLIVRFHSQEMFTDYPRHVDFDRVDKFVFVSPHIMRQAQEKFGVPPHKCEFVPISVSLRDGASYTDAETVRRKDRVALVGYTPWLKRPDLALDFLRKVNARHPEVTLHFKGKLPSAYPWMASRPDELEKYRAFFENVTETPDRVRFDSFSSSMEDFYRSVGWVLSVSDLEGCHTAVAEAGSMGCIPLIRAWPGARELYPETLIREDIDELADLFSELYGSFAESAAKLAPGFQREYLTPYVASHWKRIFGWP